MIITGGGERLQLRDRRRRAFDLLLVEGLLPPVLLLAGVVIVRSGPADYRWLPALAGITAGYWGLLVLPAFVVRRTLGRRRSSALTPVGIEGLSPSSRGLILWPEVAGIRAVWRPTGRRVRVVGKDGQAVLLSGPRSGWLPDRHFDRELAELREFAVRRGAAIVTGEPVRTRSPLVAAGLILVAVLTVAAGRVADRGAVLPWTPVAASADAACPALDAAGLNSRWPADTREFFGREEKRYDIEDYSRCRWRKPDHLDLRIGDPPFRYLTVTIGRFKPDAASSAVAWAVGGYDDYRTKVAGAEPLAGVGDEAVIGAVPDDEPNLGPTDDEVRVLARKGNVMVYLTLERNSVGGSSMAETRSTAQTLVAAMLAGVPLDSTELRLGSTERR
ncbi:hypothetical protein [Actinoplanes sp. L3-i22]|uniref:hypothetical protein n=1 Tax=Actinoplanes sp. L3-i22 TaxID=2836373 RepID=UPI001C777CAD|nr:hypothetical protein [Actinoplanes sp. L3-i22]BCY09506.1 hypothetical protein L3i22_045940 [Actinoplanes sp. L3-i22]